MSNEKKEKNVNLSYESDGKMGNKNKGNQKKKKGMEFFNTTPGSE